jgi:hypothetical protein
MRMAVQLPPKRRLCGTAEAADIYGCSEAHIRRMAVREEIWSSKISDRSFVYDADEIRRLASDRQRLRHAGKLRGRPPASSRSA